MQITQLNPPKGSDDSISERSDMFRRRPFLSCLKSVEPVYSVPTGNSSIMVPAYTVW